MPMLKGVFFAGKITDAAEWMNDNKGDVKTIFNPFGGIGRYASAVAEEGITVDNWDVQILCTAAIDGIFNQKEFLTNVDSPNGKKGYQFETRYFARIDDQSAGFMDWVGEHGTLADKFAMMTAACSQTEMGRLTVWNSTFDKFWKKFVHNRIVLSEFVNQPGTLNITEGDVFEEDLESMSYDLMILDPPTAPDIYWHNKSYTHMNINLGGVIDIPRWTLPLFYGRVRRLLSMDVGVILAKYQTGIRPSLEEYRSILEEYGTIVAEQEWTKRGHNQWMFKVEK